MQIRRVDAQDGFDTEFHAMIRRFAASSVLDEQLERIARIAQVLNRALSAQAGFDHMVVDADHRAIIGAIVKGDADAAELAARHHIRRITRFLRARLDRPPDEMVDPVLRGEKRE